ncbi:TetR/AcrR family transcriptional regulator [Lacibacter luteus]|uniref:TetR/AcrR family transcriptional regulator n=1 Tax=Lacibacter luteus TaxID=2508719 RepID=A0A4Q1CHV9_9BACT|nr:TetR/AcrR family transcriptional regulator [Lacibacter luteus]RXK59937.1 TetR/AcrR family transcriptional regulator [Lacibacter luteus]
MTARIQQKARELFFKYGIKSISLDDLAKRAGISKKTLYQHFADKQAIVHELLDELLSSYEQAFKHCAAKAANAVEEISMQADEVFPALPEVSRLFFYDLRKYDAAGWNKVSSYLNQFLLPCFIANIERGMKEELYREELPVDLTAEIRMQQINTIFDSTEFSTRKLHTVQLMKDLSQFYLHAITTTKGKTVIRKYSKQ